MPTRRADPRVGHFESTVWDFSADTKFTAPDALRRPLAPREEGPVRRRFRAERADRLLDRSQRSGHLSHRGARRHPRMEQGIRENRLQGRDRGEAAGGRRRVRHVRRPAFDRALVRRNRRGICHRPVDSSTRAPAKSSTRRSQSRNRGRAVNRTFVVEQARRRGRPWMSSRSSLGVDGSSCTYADRSPVRNAVRPRRAGRAWRDRAGQPGSGGVRRTPR